jgi:hypothetical protein
MTRGVVTRWRFELIGEPNGGPHRAGGLECAFRAASGGRAVSTGPMRRQGAEGVTAPAGVGTAGGVALVSDPGLEHAASARKIIRTKARIEGSYLLGQRPSGWVGLSVSSDRHRLPPEVGPFLESVQALFAHDARARESRVKNDHPGFDVLCVFQGVVRK